MPATKLTKTTQNKISHLWEEWQAQLTMFDSQMQGVNTAARFATLASNDKKGQQEVENSALRAYHTLVSLGEKVLDIHEMYSGALEEKKTVVVHNLRVLGVFSAKETEVLTSLQEKLEPDLFQPYEHTTAQVWKALQQFHRHKDAIASKMGKILKRCGVTVPQNPERGLA